MSEISPLFEVPGYKVILLSHETIPALQGFLERCADYNQLVSGEPPSSSAAQSLFTECPPGRSSEDKLVIGVTVGDGSLVGVLDVLRGYPQKECWWVGLLLLDPSWRNRGLGRQIYQSFERWLGQLGVKYILLGVIEANENAYRFWQSLGFELVEKQPPREFGNSTHVVITMVRDLVKYAPINVDKSNCPV
jgi:GNAT superfamily N-acetyltransferase